MRCSILWFVLFFCLSRNGDSQIPFTCKGQYYLSLTRQGESFSGLYEVLVSPQNGMVRLDTIASNIGLVLNAMGYRVTDNFIYGMDPVRGRLRKIGRDGVARDLGVPAGLPPNALYYAGDITPDGRYLMIIGIGGDGGQLVRIDLDDPMYACSVTRLSDASIRVVDIAFDPFTGILYAHDLAASRIVTIQPETGFVNTSFRQQPEIDQLGALFFDAYGQLYGYGSYQTLLQDKFVKVNKQTGEISLLGQGPVSSGQDGCACPYTVELQKEVLPDTVYECSRVAYTFRILNGSGITTRNVTLTDSLPMGMQWDTIIRQPFGGVVTLRNRYMQIDGMTIPPGLDSVVVFARTLSGTEGVYRNQAALANLPPSLGQSVPSDNPRTLRPKDSTDLLVLPLPDFIEGQVRNICRDDSILVDVPGLSADILWDGIKGTSQQWIKAPDTVVCTFMTGCSSRQYVFRVTDDAVYINAAEDTLSVMLGESVQINLASYQPQDNVTFLWNSAQGTLLVCAYCESTTATPLNNDHIFIYITDENGCQDVDSVYIRVVKDRSVHAPNIINPSSASGNRLFTLTFPLSAVTLQWLEIYDRWGNLVYREADLPMGTAMQGWDGTIGGQNAVEGVYTWVSSVSYIDGFSQIVSGSITVLR